jgi:LacI family transcriptional regulator
MHRSGASRVALVTGPRGTYTADERYAGWMDALTHEERPLADRLARFTSFNVEGGEAATASLLQNGRLPTVYSSQTACSPSGALRALRESAWQIGKDILCTAFDDAPWTGLIGGTLDVIRQPAVEVGRTAAQLLVSRIEHPKTDPEQMILHPTLSFTAPSSITDNHRRRFTSAQAPLAVRDTQ